MDRAGTTMGIPVENFAARSCSRSSLPTDFQRGDPAAVASGISEALITTATGLIVAIPTIAFHRYLSGRADKVFKSVELYLHAFSNTLLVRFQNAKQQQ